MVGGWKFAGLLTLLALLATGCARSDSSASNETTAIKPNPAYLLTAEPADAQGVGEVRKSAEDGQEVTLVGRVAGSAKPFVDGLAAFTIVDPSVQPCPEEEGCPTPWDCCCDLDAVKENNATVKIVDASGQVVSKDARQLLGIRELSMVVVRGEAKRDDAGNLTVEAEKVFVKN